MEQAPLSRAVHVQGALWTRGGGVASRPLMTVPAPFDSTPIGAQKPRSRLSMNDPPRPVPREVHSSGPGAHCTGGRGEQATCAPRNTAPCRRPRRGRRPYRTNPPSGHCKAPFRPGPVGPVPGILLETLHGPDAGRWSRVRGLNLYGRVIGPEGLAQTFPHRLQPGPVSTLRAAATCSVISNLPAKAGDRCFTAQFSF